MSNQNYNFIHTDSIQPVVSKIVETITSSLDSGQKVLWLLSGGSSVEVAVGAAKLLKSLTNLSSLTIGLIDERYGPVDHPDSNWYKLMAAGFDLKPANYVPILNNLPFDQTVFAYNTELIDLMGSSDTYIGLFGIGADGHTAGILPGSKAAFEYTNLVTGYKGPDFERITITFPVIDRINVAVVYAGGQDKLPVIRELRDTSTPIVSHPAQALKLAKSLYIYSSL